MKKAIVFKNVSKNYKQLKAVDGISLTIEKGRILWFVGAKWCRQINTNQYDGRIGKAI